MAFSVAAAAAVAVGILVVDLRHRSAPAPRVTAPGTQASALSIGEAVFQAGVAPDGRPIPRTIGQGGSGVMGGGGMMGGGGGMMMGRGCAGCHGADGRGLTTPRFTSPNITYANLTDPKGMLEVDGTRGPTYTDATLRRAVTTGVDPEGDHLDWPMPQWQLTDQEWSGLLAYLKTLD